MCSSCGFCPISYGRRCIHSMVEKTITVDKEAFEDEKDADEYFAEIDEYLCGPK